MRSIDYHMHTRFSGDSEADPREHVIQAIKMGLDEICFTDHRDFDYPIDVFDLDVEGYYQTIMALKKEFADKIIHVVVDDTPQGYTHDRDTFQKNAVGRGLKNCTDDDIIVFSDLDEIPNPEKVKEIIADFDENKIYHFAQRLFYCYLNMEEVSGSLLSCRRISGGEKEKVDWIQNVQLWAA